MKSALLVLTMLASITASAQFDNLIKKQLDKGKKTAELSMEAERARIDSSDFNYAISVIDNSGMMDIRDAGETVVKTVTSVNSMTKSADEKTASMRCRDLLDIAEKLYEARSYPAAEASFITAKAAYETEGITSDINYSKVLADMGLLYATMGRFELAEKYTTDAMANRESTLGKNSKAYGSSLNNHGVLMADLARYRDAEVNFDEGLKVIGQRVGLESQEYAIALNNQAILFSDIGRYDAAIDNLKKASAIVDKLQKKNLRNQVGFKSNLALLYQQTGKFTEAETIYLSLEKSLGSQNPYYAGVLNNLALLYMQMSKFDKVEGYLQNSAKVYKSKFGEQNHNYAKALNDLGNFYRMQGRMDEAEKTLQQALAIRTTALGENHPDYVKSQEDLGVLYWKKGDFAKADEFYGAAMNKSVDFINHNFPPMSEAEKTKYWDVLQPRFQRFYNYCLDAAATDPVALQTLFEYQMVTKGLLLNSTNQVKKSILGSGDNALIQDYLTWLDKKEALARYYSLSREELATEKVDLAALEKDANDREKDLSARSKEFSSGYASDRTPMKAVTDLLGDLDALVEVVRVRKFDKDLTAEPRYAMLVLTRGAAAPKVVVMDNGKDLETKFAKYYKNAIIQRIPDEFSYIQFWSKVDPLLTGKKNIYFSPDGVYSQLNINTIKKPGGGYLVNTFDVVVFGNAKDLITSRVKKPVSAKTAFLLGFPDFKNAAPALPGTKAEIEAVTNVLKAAGYSVTKRTQAEATEENVKSIKGQTMVHIATHGYFLPDSEGDAMGVSEEHAKKNPLLRSGLILSGAPDPAAEQKRADLSGTDNGILTAYEAMNLNLEGTSLIVLSACETGLGEVRAGEGVYGLQRAFQAAGARTLLMSLWKVDDAATQLLMTSFYTNWTKTGNKLKALKAAQAGLMANPKYKDPYYWGAFVMLGM
jgi:CHAT domain-containing protein/tetratricopeptide (TPR) repeat protein